MTVWGKKLMASGILHHFLFHTVMARHAVSEAVKWKASRCAENMRYQAAVEEYQQELQKEGKKCGVHQERLRAEGVRVVDLPKKPRRPLKSTLLELNNAEDDEEDEDSDVEKS